MQTLITEKTQAIQCHVTETANKLHDSVEHASSETTENLKVIWKAWDSFRDEEGGTETDKSCTRPRTIPPALKSHAERLSCTVGMSIL